jgi:hypothetical protein
VLTENAQGECELCESHGNPLATGEGEFEVVLGTAGSAPVKQLTVAERLAAILDDAEEEESSDSDSEQEMGDLMVEEAFEDE